MLIGNHVCGDVEISHAGVLAELIFVERFRLTASPTLIVCAIECNNSYVAAIEALKRQGVFTTPYGEAGIELDHPKPDIAGVKVLVAPDVDFIVSVHGGLEVAVVVGHQIGVLGEVHGRRNDVVVGQSGVLSFHAPREGDRDVQKVPLVDVHRQSSENVALGLQREHYPDIPGDLFAEKNPEDVLSGGGLESLEQGNVVSSVRKVFAVYLDGKRE